MYHSLSISGLMTLEMHALNNEGAEGNTMMTRMVDIIVGGRKFTVNAISGDMFKHIFAEHLIAEAKQNGLPLCEGCRVADANRIAADRTFTASPDFTDRTADSVILSAALRRCIVDDCAGILLTGKIGKDRSIARKSCVEFGWVVGKPDAVTTESYFHAKYVPEGRGKGSGEGGNLGQNIFHRPASSGEYAVVVNIDLYKVGRNDITLEYAVPAEERTRRIAALLRSLVHTLVKPAGAHRNTQNPHVVDFSGVLAVSRTTVPAPCVSPLNSGYREEMRGVAANLNQMSGAQGVGVTEFQGLASFTGLMAGVLAPTAG